MHIELSNVIRLSGAPVGMLKSLAAMLTIPNPAYNNALKHGFSAYGINKYLVCFSMLDNGDMILPRGMIHTLLPMCKDAEIEYTLSDKRKQVPIPYVSKEGVQFRPYQQDAIKRLLDSRVQSGVIMAPPGSGKTFIGMSLLQIFGQKTLWVTHTKPLATQAVDRAFEYMNLQKEDVGYIGAGKWKIGNVLTVALVQTLCRRPDETVAMTNDFGMVIVDECLPAGTKILMLDGTTKNVEDVENGDHTTFGTVSNKFSRKTDKLISLRGGWGELGGTPTHRLPCIRRDRLRMGKNHAYKPFVETDVVMETMSKINEGDFLLVIDEGSSNFVRKVEYRGVRYRCMEVVEKEVLSEDLDVYDFTTKDHLFIANGVLSSNCHHTPSTTFSSVVGVMNPFYTFGLTATPYRADGLEPLMFSSIGPIVVTIDRTHTDNILITPTVEVVELSHIVFESNNTHHIIDRLINDPVRNRIIISDVLRDAKAGHHCLVISGRREHCKMLHETLKPLWEPTEYVTSSEKKKHIESRIEAFRNKEINVLISTADLLFEGFDVDFLDRLYMATPFRSEARTKQVIGRLQRKAKGKTSAKMYDYVDVNVGVLRSQFYSHTLACRHNAYVSVGAEIVKRTM